MKKVFAIAFSFPPDSGSGALRNLKILKYLPENQWQVQLLTHRYTDAEFEAGKALVEEIPASINLVRTRYIDTPRTFGAIRSALSPFKKKPRKGKAGNVIDENASAGSAERSGFFSRFKDFLTHCFSVPDRKAGWLPFAVWAGIRAMRKNKPDVIYAVGRPWTAFLVGYCLKLVFRKPLVIDFMDPWGACTWSWSKPRVFQWIDLRLEKFVSRRADFIVANTDTLREDFIQRLNIPPERVGVVTCGYDPNDFKPLPKAQGDSLSSNSAQIFTVTHTGSFYKRRSPLMFLRAVKQLLEQQKIDRHSFRVNLIGRNSVRDPELDALLAEPWVSEIVDFVSWIPHDEIMGCLASSNLLLLVQPDTKLQIPAKLYEYVIAGKPVLALCDVDGAVDRIVRKEGWGDVVANDDVDSIKKSLRRSIEKHQNGEVTIRSSGVEDYSTSALAKRLSGYLEDVIQVRPATSGRLLTATSTDSVEKSRETNS